MGKRVRYWKLKVVDVIRSNRRVSPVPIASDERKTSGGRRREAPRQHVESFKKRRDHLSPPPAASR
ncbi:hypothetical protein BO94DRAFT_532649 [Aspergillus sclerotioniger CBS 115572]|uniref:Uncharacterized protein n=1 Tax=Aspergillus sclerotioniger CBS 115572 TaxID=1450535 RepID=A0A317X549_9EURO|nr:hypothetical protein BO94DRAFT_532649 [Aspergillus sclerotioniger CBS 115572]PWY93716.1 hypothetical protein BO94DRAFT_532649 [Aspergillus sclerotioniger CBS 115572]